MLLLMICLIYFLSILFLLRRYYFHEPLCLFIEQLLTDAPLFFRHAQSVMAPRDAIIFSSPLRYATSDKAVED